MDMGAIFLGLASALIGGLLGVFATYWRTKYTIKEQDLSKRVEELCTSVSKLEELCCAYFSDVESRRTISKPYVLGVKTKITLLMDYLNKQYSGFYTVTISSMLVNFFKACTGGDFESLDSKVDPERQREILITGETLKIEIMRTRNLLY